MISKQQTTLLVADSRRKAVILGANINQDQQYHSILAETIELTKAANFEIVKILETSRRTIDRKYFVGKGKVQELKETIEDYDADIVVVTHTLSNSQHAKLSKESGKEVLDYAGLILAIFASRAKTAQGKLQVELAEEVYGRAKLKGAWTHLERQRGSLSATGGPGERQLELDKRQVARRIKQLRKKLDKRRLHTNLVAHHRSKSVNTVSLVGYTNAGKSTLFSQLANSKAPASSRLFETLDTTSRRMYLEDGSHAVISDTVGFIRNLPHELIEAFQSTLNEAIVADLLLIVIDADDQELLTKLDIVNETLVAIGAGEVPKLVILNKCDLCCAQIAIERLKWSKIPALAVSALSGIGLTELRNQLTKYFNSQNLDNDTVSLISSQTHLN